MCLTLQNKFVKLKKLISFCSIMSVSNFLKILLVLRILIQINKAKKHNDVVLFKSSGIHICRSQKSYSTSGSEMNLNTCLQK